MNKTTMTGHGTRAAVAAFSEVSRLEAAVDELLAHGFDRADLSVMATTPTVEHALGHIYRKVADVADDPSVPHIAFIDTATAREAKESAVATLASIGAVAATGAVVASGGAVAVAIAAAVVASGVGATIAAALADLIGAAHAESIADQLERGGILLWVRTASAKAETTARDILRRNGGTHVHVHAFPLPPPTREGGVSEDLAWINKPIATWFGRNAEAGPALRYT
jgi:hypothetical protein